MAASETETNIQVKIEFDTSEEVIPKNEITSKEAVNINGDFVDIKVEYIKEEPVTTVDYGLGINQPTENNYSVTECLLSESTVINYGDYIAGGCYNKSNENNLAPYPLNKFSDNQSGKLSKEKKKAPIPNYKSAFTCNSCNKNFTTKGHLKRHVNNHCHPKRSPYVCDVCHKIYPFKSLLIVHMRAHTGERPYTCNICNKNYIHRYNLAEHKKIHTQEKSFVCDMCDKRFRQKYDLKRHILIHTGERPNPCYMCDKKFSRKYDLNVHLKTHTKKPYVCHLCQKMFTSKHYINLHKKTHMEEKCNKIPKSTLTKHKKARRKDRPINKKCVLTKDKRTYLPVDFESTEVQEDATSGTGLKNILIKTTDDNVIENSTNCYIKQEFIPIEKDIVPKTEPVSSEEENAIENCLSNVGLVNVKEEFVEEEPVVTTEDKWQVNKPMDSALDSLHESTETTDNFTCHVCRRKYTSQRNLKRHMVIHSDNRSFFTCEVCKQRCLQRKSLVIHMRTHTGEKPFACNLCDKRFTQKCDLTKHLRAHTGEKPFSCHICGKNFSQKYNMQMHIRTHTGERPFACDKCEKTFQVKCCLTKHLKTHDKLKPLKKKVK